MLNHTKEKANHPKILLYLLPGLVILGIVLLLFGRLSAKEAAMAPEGFSIEKLTFCHYQNPLGIDDAYPVFGWQMKSSKRGSMQSAYRITVSESAEALNGGTYLWDSGKVLSGLSVGIPYEGPALLPQTRYYWQVSVWDENDTEAVSTEEAFFETGLLTGSGSPSESSLASKAGSMTDDGAGSMPEGGAISMPEGGADNSCAAVFGDAKWISAPKQNAIAYHPVSDALSYDISYDFSCKGTGASFVFGAHEGRYGNLYLCEIWEREGQSTFSFQKMEGGTFVSKESVDITSCCTNATADGADPKAETNYKVKLSVREDTLNVMINDTSVGSFSMESIPVGSIGYYKSRGTSYTRFDNILVTDSDGKELYREDFEDKDTIFAPYHTVLEEGRLKAGSGMLLTPFYESPAPYFRREFTTEDKTIASARIYMTALGSFALSLDGNRISNDYFAPGKLTYNRKIAYETYDITGLLSPGKDHVLGAILLHGWYDRAVGYPEIYNPWGDTNALLGKLEIKYTDGTVQVIGTDQNFLCSTDTPVRNDDIYQGEFYDANKEFAGFDLPGFDASGWTAAAENQVDEAYLTLPAASKISEPIVCIRELTPLTVTTPAENISVYDFGQNFAGTCRIRVKGEKGQILTLRYGEHLNTENLINKDDLPGTVFTENLLTADATDYYVLKGDAKGEIFVPEFTYHGFRYLQIEGLKEPLAAEDVQGLVLSTDLPQTGSFECSDPLLNQYYQNTINSMQSNFMDNPTDCPQRDERHGWAGDAQVFSGTASYHADTYSFYRKYLDDMRLLQTDGGSFTDMAPRNFGTDPEGRGGAATNNCWGDAPVIITWNLYTQYGDVSILKENYEALCKWVDVLEATSENYIRRWGGYGDHLALESTPAEITDTAWCARSADLLSRMSKILDKPEDAARYRVLYENFKTAWQNAYILPDGMTVCNSQTSYALGLSFGLFPEELAPAATGFFLQLIENSNYHINTGFSGIGYLLPSLSAQGHDAAAYNLLLQKEAPSHLSQVQKGATTTWEMWDAYREEPDGTYFLDGSFNHYTYGTSAGFLYTHTLGITSDENNPGFKHFYFAPHVTENLSYAGGSYESAYGLISSKWERTKDGYRFDFTVPANTTATLTLPALPDGKDYFEGKKAAVNADGVTLISKDETKVIYGLSSGNYSFTEGK